MMRGTDQGTVLSGNEGTGERALKICCAVHCDSTMETME